MARVAIARQPQDTALKSEDRPSPRHLRLVASSRAASNAQHADPRASGSADPPHVAGPSRNGETAPAETVSVERSRRSSPLRRGPRASDRVGQHATPSAEAFADAAARRCAELAATAAARATDETRGEPPTPPHGASGVRGRRPGSSPADGDDSAPRVATHLLITLVGNTRDDLLADLSARIFEAGGNIEDSRGTRLAGSQVAYLAVAGNWRTLDKLEQAIPEFARRRDLSYTLSRVRETTDDDPAAMPYSVDVVALDQPGVLRALAEFFRAHGVRVREWQSRVYSAGGNATRMLSANLLIDIPADRHLASLRADFMDFCDDLNLDGVLDPVKA